MDKLFKGIFDTELVRTISVNDFLLCLFVSLALGLVLTLAYMWKNQHSKSFLVTLALLPAVVCVVIMMVNGNIGAGVAVAGAFSLVRFRSAPGRQISRRRNRRHRRNDPYALLHERARPRARR